MASASGQQIQATPGDVFLLSVMFQPHGEAFYAIVKELPEIYNVNYITVITYRFRPKYVNCVPDLCMGAAVLGNPVFKEPASRSSFRLEVNGTLTTLIYMGTFRAAIDLDDHVRELLRRYHGGQIYPVAAKLGTRGEKIESWVM